jgi:hypothetical protein
MSTTAQTELDIIIKEICETIDSFDVVDTVLFRFVFDIWRQSHTNRDGLINVATTIRAMPELIRKARNIRAKMPDTLVRKIRRKLTLAAFIGDLYEMYPNRHSIMRRLSFSFQVITFRCRQLATELIARF